MKEALQFLVGEERRHLKLFEGLLGELRKEAEDAFEEDSLFDSFDYGIFVPYQTMEDLDKVLTSPDKAIRLGVVVEDKSIKFYRSCLKKISAARLKRELTKIIAEETKHKALFEGMLKELGSA
jgi:rubrerythrin